MATAQSPPRPEFLTSRDILVDSDETSPLLPTNNAKYSSHSETWRSSVSAFFDENAGLSLVAASQFFFSGMHICVKWLNSLDEPVPMLELIWVRMAITSICSVAYMYWRKIPDPLLGPKGVRGLLVLRGFTGFIGLAGMYASLVHLSLSDATMLTFVAPILTGFSGAIILKETVSLRETFAGFFSFFGVILIARPQFLFGGSKGDLADTVTHGQRMQSVAFGLIGVLGATAAYTTLRAIGKRAHTLHSLVFFSSSCVLGSTIGMIIFKTSPVMPTRPLWLAMLLLLGVLDLTSQSLLVMGFQRETASRGVLACYTSVIFAAMFDFIVFHTTPPALSIAGAAIIISAAISISLSKRKIAIKLPTSPTVVQPVPASPVHDNDPQP